MKIIESQSAALTNIEVLAYLTANPPRRPPNPPPNSRNWVPSPDLRDHNTVVKEIHNYVTRLSPHLLNYPRYVHEGQLQSASATASAPTQSSSDSTEQQLQIQQLRPIDHTPTPLDHAIRSLIARLKPFKLTKAEVLMIVNLGVGLGNGPPADEYGQEQDQMEVDGDVNGDAGMNGEQGDGEEDGNETGAYAEGGEAGEAEAQDGVAGGDEEGEGLAEEDYGALALLDTVIEEREERLSTTDVGKILAIIRECLGQGEGLQGHSNG